MTYIAGGSIQATDFNSFVSQINEVFADSNSGSVVAPPADFGYGHLALSTVAVGQNVGAAEWTSLFSTIKDIGTHQGTVLDTSGIPALVNAGNIIYAITALQQVVNDAKASRLSIDASQIAMIPLFSPSQPSYSAPQWTTGIEFVYTVDFGSWNNARHFFNLGGAIGMVGSIPDGAPLTTNHFWHDMLVNAGVIKMDHTSTSSNGIATGTIGFYDLTTSYQEIYRKTPTGGGYYYYNGSYMNIRAKLNSAPGTDGIIQFAIGLYDADGTPTGKTGPLVWTINSFQSSGAIPYLGTVTAATVGTGGGGSGTPGFDLVAYSGGGGNPLLTLQMSPTSLNDTINGSGTANAGPITCTVLNGVPPYSFAWTNVTSSPNTATISAPVNTPTTSQVSISKSLLNAETFSGTIRCTVTDGAAQSAYLNANWSFTSISSLVGEAIFTTPGVHIFTVPAGVTSICAVAIGGGAGGTVADYGGVWNVTGSSGGGLAYSNNISVSPGQNITVTVGNGGAGAYASAGNNTGSIGGNSSFGPYCTGFGGTPGTVAYALNSQPGVSGGSFAFTGAGGGGAGGASGPVVSGANDRGITGSGAAGGYNGTGGIGAGMTAGVPNIPTATTSNGTTGGGSATNGAITGFYGGTGGGASLYGPGSGSYGGGGAGAQANYPEDIPDFTAQSGQPGAVRIIWGPGRSFPNNAS